MRLNEIKQIDIGGDLLEDYSPKDEECFFEWLTISIGIKGEAGAVYYNLLVCTPDWLKKELKSTSVQWGRHKLIINKFDPDLIKKEIDNKLLKLLNQFDNDNDVSFSEKIGRYAHWEFEDYIPYEDT